MKKVLAILLAVLMAVTVMAVSVSAAESDVAAIGSATYATLTEALTYSEAGDTITLLNDVAENVTISKNIILDGSGKQYSGVISVSGGKTVVVDNVKFAGGRIEANTKSTANNLTVKNCSFEGPISTYAIIINGGSNLTIENCKAKDIGQGLAYAKNSVNNIVLKDIELDGATYGLNMVNNTKTILENVTMTNVTRGLQFQTNSAKTITFKNCVISVNDHEAAAPVYISHKADTTQTFVFKGKNDFGTDDLTFGSSLVKIVMDPFAVGDETFTTLNEAIAAAKDGDVIKVIDDTTLSNEDIGEKVSGMYPYAAVTDKKITIDLNGKTIKVNPSLDANMLAVFYAGGTGELTLKDSSEAQSGTVDVVMAEGTEAYSMFTALGTESKMYIESGNYSIDKIDYGQSMIYAGQNNQMFVSGGSFVLGNAKTRDPGNGQMQPWMFNAHGDGMKFITVTGGTYNTDPTHYHGEASYPVCYMVVEKDNGMYAVELIHTPGAAASCQAAQICTVCNIELDAIKEHELSEYVSNNDADCYNDGTKTAHCIYGCGLEDTIVDEGTKKEHTDDNNNGVCDNCKGDFCGICGEIHNDMIRSLFCLLAEVIRLLFVLLGIVF